VIPNRPPETIHRQAARAEIRLLWLRDLYEMPDHSIHKAGDLDRDERIVVERWLGRSLGNDETISVNAYRPHSAPAGDEREILRRQIVAQAREIGSRAPAANEEDVESLVDEAIAATRGRRG
jgi:hypothetical protein